MRKSREQKGITLIALVVTITIMLLLSSIIISSIQNNGVLNQAGDEKNKFAQTDSKYNDLMSEQINLLNSNLYQNATGSITVTENVIQGGDDTPSDEPEVDDKLRVKEAQQMGVISPSQNINVWDEFDNKIVVPAGFKITYDADTVPEGIVIEDVIYEGTSGSQFVWVPVGQVYTNSNQTSSKTITLGRYSSMSISGYTIKQPINSITYKNNVELTVDKITCIEYQPTNTTTNQKARDINHFYESATRAGGYYIGRYEAGDSVSTVTNTSRNVSTSDTNTMVCKKNQYTYDYVTQKQASDLSRGMYLNGYSTGTFSSDLVNSYAWDTAIRFIMTFSTSAAGKNFANIGIQDFVHGSYRTGEFGEEYLNINDMSGNSMEWTTETVSSKTPLGSYCVMRGSYLGSEGTVRNYF